MSQQTVFLIGGTGAQGIPVIEELSREPEKYALKILTRDSNSRRAKELAALGSSVSFLEGSFANEEILRSGFSGSDIAFVNIDGFNTGEKTELYWGIRSYELALECGVKFFIWGNLEYAYRKSGYKPQYRAGHYDGKGRVGEWILQQNKTNHPRMKACLYTTGPYIDMAISQATLMTPSLEKDSAGDPVVTWRVPLGPGAVAHVALCDVGFQVKWLIDHQREANGMDLEVAIAHVTYTDLAAAFEKVTGHKARSIDVSLEEYWKTGPVARAGGIPAGYNADPNDPATMTIKQNFSGFWNFWRASGENKGIIRRDYEMLDRLFPQRIKSAEEWFRHEDAVRKKAGKGSLLEAVLATARGKGHSILKVGEDGRKGKL